MDFEISKKPSKTIKLNTNLSLSPPESLANQQSAVARAEQSGAELNQVSMKSKRRRLSRMAGGKVALSSRRDFRRDNSSPVTYNRVMNI
jgi:hypothetical protein